MFSVRHLAPLLAALGCTAEPPRLLDSGNPAVALVMDDAGIIWGDAQGTIRAVDRQSGTLPRTIASGTPMANLAIDSTHVYWTGAAGQGLYRVPRPGGAVEALAPIQVVSEGGLALDDQAVYLVQRPLNAIGVIKTVIRIAKQGGPATALATLPACNPPWLCVLDVTQCGCAVTAIVVVGDRIRWVHWIGVGGPTLWETSKQGGTPVEAARDVPSGFAPQQVIIEDLEVHVGRLDLWAGPPVSACRGGGIAIDGPSGFLSGCNSYRDPEGGAIFAVDRADLDAPDLNGRLRLVVDGDFRPALLAVDARELVFSTEDGRVMAADKEAGSRLPRYSPTPDPH